jgi:hypothetical protein
VGTPATEAGGVTVAGAVCRYRDRPIAPEAQEQPPRGSPKYPQGHGFIAAISAKASQPAHGSVVCTRGVAARAGTMIARGGQRSVRSRTELTPRGEFGIFSLSWQAKGMTGRQNSATSTTLR